MKARAPLLAVAVLALLALANASNELDELETMLGTARNSKEAQGIKKLLSSLHSKLMAEMKDADGGPRTAQSVVNAAKAKMLKARDAYNKAKGAKSDADNTAAREKALVQKELAIVKALMRRVDHLIGVKSGSVSPASSNLQKFKSNGVIAQALLQAACVGQRKGLGSSQVIGRSCGGSTTCDQICRSQGMHCQRAYHMYSNQPAAGWESVGLKTHIYNGCSSTGCGPNACCCANAKSEEEDVETNGDFDEEDLSLALLDEDEDEGKLETKWDRYGSLTAHIQAQAACTAMNPNQGWTFAVRRTCGGGATCSSVCSGAKDSQAGKLKCFNALHLYSNGPWSSNGKKGLDTYKYNACGGGCGPNYCCCSNGGKALADDEEAEAGTEEEEEATDVAVSSAVALNNFDRFGLDGQVLAEATCMALNDKMGGWTFAVKRDCQDRALTCEDVCATVSESQSKNNVCFNSLHVYSNQPVRDVAKPGLKTYKYNSCGGGCGPNFCCCRTE